METRETARRSPAGHGRGTSGDRLLDGLNAEQVAAVTAPNGPMLIAAGPGSGKTRVTCTRIAYLIERRNVAAQAIGAITFTRRGAAEMAARTAALVGSGTARTICISTFHRLCGAILRTEGSAIGLPTDFRVVQGGDQIGRMREPLFRIGVDTRIHKPQAMLSSIGWMKNRMLDPSEPDAYGEHLNGELHAKAARAYKVGLGVCAAGGAAA